MTSAAELLTDSADDTAKAVACEQMQAAAAAKARIVFDMLFLLYKIFNLLKSEMFICLITFYHNLS